ncbi:BnaC05g35170D [Brassica napus]|uniref:BnaC05g35170D protein n=2 Tax=Brassica napus TaxID=3708 RepID=A0A078GGY0_BRANA|nr:BnaC05g35170D [Brassica napus]
MEKKAETLLSLISRQLPKTLITTSRSEWNCIKNGTVEVVLPLSIEREVDAYLEAFFDEREDGYLRIPETSRNEYLATGNSHYPLPENILDQTKSVQLKSMQQNWLWGRSGYNWATVTKNGTTVKTGDVVSVSGKGRLKVRL